MNIQSIGSEAAVLPEKEVQGAEAKGKASAKKKKGTDETAAFEANLSQVIENNDLKKSAELKSVEGSVQESLKKPNGKIPDLVSDKLGLSKESDLIEAKLNNGKSAKKPSEASSSKAESFDPETLAMIESAVAGASSSTKKSGEVATKLEKPDHSMAVAMAKAKAKTADMNVVELTGPQSKPGFDIGSEFNPSLKKQIKDGAAESLSKPAIRAQASSMNSMAAPVSAEAVWTGNPAELAGSPLPSRESKRMGSTDANLNQILDQKPSLSQWSGEDFVSARNHVNQAHVGKTSGESKAQQALGLEPRSETLNLPARDLQSPVVGSETGAMLAPFNRPPVEVSGHVVKGAMSMDRLSSVVLRDMADGIGQMRDVGGGEMRIRLQPDNLGELRVLVKTYGGNVSLKVEASDPAARRVIEDSMGYLRDSLAGQNLRLQKVDLGLIQAPSASVLGNGLSNPDNASTQRADAWNAPGFSHNAGQNGVGQNPYSSDQGQRGWYDAEESESLAPRAVRSASSGLTQSARASSQPRSGSSRIDVMA